jgi:hypothetical protein
MPTPMTEPLPTPLPTTEGSSQLDPDIAAEMDLIQTQVIALRGLEPSYAVPRELLSPEQLRQNVINDFLSEYTPEDAAQDAAILHLLGLLPADFNLIDFYTELYSEQIAGYYDDEAKAMYVVQGSGFTGSERITYAHEYVHVLQDQVFDFKGSLGFNDEACEEDSERCAGIQALIEGDATVTELEWFSRYASEQDYKDILEFYANFESPVYDSAPHYMQEDFTFPYLFGQTFVEHLMEDGGFDAVDAAFANVPVSTEQILHPDKYPEDTPIPVSLPDLSQALGEGWEEVERNVMGEWYTYLILAHGYDADTRVEDKEALTASEGWGGDTYLVYYNAQIDRYAFVMRSVWDAPRDLTDFYEGMLEYAEKRWGKPESETKELTAWSVEDLYTSLYRDDTYVTWIIAPDANTTELIQLSLP